MQRGEQILEIGPGTGALTRELLAEGGRVLAVEKDEALVAQLEETFAREIMSDTLRVIAADIRDFSPEQHGLTRAGYVLAANIPYYITGEILRKFLEAKAHPRALALLIQKEVAERILARDKKESISHCRSKRTERRVLPRKYLAEISPRPHPSIPSILVIEKVSKEFLSGITEKGFFEVVRAGFASKRKYLANNLAVRYRKEPVLHAFAKCDVDEKARAEDLPLQKWKLLTGALQAHD